MAFVTGHDGAAARAKDANSQCIGCSYFIVLDNAGGLGYLLESPCLAFLLCIRNFQLLFLQAMSSPAKRRKLDNGNKTSGQTRGLEYFFSKQRQGASSSNTPADNSPSSAGQTDEELARKLQAEYDKEASRSTPNENESLKGVEDNPVVGEGAGTSEPQTAEIKSTPTKGGTTLKLQSSGTAEDSVASSIPLDESPLTFETGKYIPQLQESWSGQEGNASYALLARCFTLVNGTQSRIKIVDTLVNCVRLIVESDPSSLLPAVRVLFYGSRLEAI